MEKISLNVNKFWKDICLNWSKLSKGSIDSPEDVLTQSIWFNKNLKINNQTVFYENWCESGIFFINDLLNGNSELMSWQEFQDTYNINSNFLQFHGILHMIPKAWKDKITTSEKLVNVTCENYDFVKKKQKILSVFLQKIPGCLLGIACKTTKKMVRRSEYGN